MLELKEDKGTEYIIAWKSKGLFKSILKALFNPLSPGIKQFEYKLGIQFLNDSLVAGNNNYLTKMLKAYIELDSWPRNLFNTFTSRQEIACLVQLYSKNSNKSNYMYSGYEIAFDGAGLWKFGNDFTRNVAICGVDNSSIFQIIARIFF